MQLRTGMMIEIEIGVEGEIEIEIGVEGEIEIEIK